MPYFHVFLSVESAPQKQRFVFSDVGEVELKGSFVRPFKNSRNLLCTNELVPVGSIRRFTITAADDRNEAVLNRFRKSPNEAFHKLNAESRGLVFRGVWLRA